MKDRGWLPGLAAGLAFLALVLVASLEARSRQSSNAGAAQTALKEFVETLAQHRSRYGYLPGDLNHDGEIDEGVEITQSIGGQRVVLRAVARRASALPNPPRGRNLIELWNLPCGIAQTLDSRTDDGNLAKGNVRASIAACAAGGENDPVRVVAVAASL
jgi:hypothetical protein